MNSQTTALITFVCVFAGLLFGSFLRWLLPEHHVREDSKDVIKLGTGLIATLTALVLGLLVGSAKNSFDSLNAGLMQSGAKIITLDRILSQYGPETREARDLLRRSIASAVQRYWPEDALEGVQKEPEGAMPGMEKLNGLIRQFSPQNDSQRWLQNQALTLSSELLQLRWQLLEQSCSALPQPFLVVLICWLAILFASFGLLAPRNTTVTCVLLLCALSVSGAIFLVEEMGTPMTGLMKASSAPLLNAYHLVGK